MTVVMVIGQSDKGDAQSDAENYPLQLDRKVGLKPPLCKDGYGRCRAKRG